MRASTIVTIFGGITIAAAIVLLIMAASEDSKPPVTSLEHGKRLFRIQGCAACHAIGGGISRGPDLAGLIPRLRVRLSNEAYKEHLIGLQKQRADVYKIFQETYVDIMKRQGDDRIRAWIEAHLLNPRFDNFMGRMPAYGHLTQNPQQMELLIAYLFTLQ